METTPQSDPVTIVDTFIGAAQDAVRSGLTHDPRPFDRLADIADAALRTGLSIEQTVRLIREYTAATKLLTDDVLDAVIENSSLRQ